MTIPDDQLDPDELGRRLHQLVQNFPRLLHEQIAAAKADTETALELTREGFNTLERRITRAGMVSRLQSSLLVLLASLALPGDPVDSTVRRWIAELATRLAAGIEEFQSWSDEKWDDDTAWNQLVDRIFADPKDFSSPPS